MEGWMDGWMDGWMGKSSQLDPRVADTKNTKWRLDDTGKRNRSRS